MSRKIFLVVFLSLIAYCSFGVDITITGPTAVCPGATETYTVNATTAIGTVHGCFQWNFYFNGASIGYTSGIQCPCGGTTSSSTTTFTWPMTTGTTQVKVTFLATADPSCIISPNFFYGYLDGLVRSPTPGNITTSGLFCTGGQSRTVTIPGIANNAASCFYHYEYDWIVPTGWTVIPNGGFGYSSITGGIRTFAKSVTVTAPASPTPGLNTITVKTDPIWPWPTQSVGTLWVGPPKVLDYNNNPTSIGLQANTAVARSPFPCIPKTITEYNYIRYVEITDTDYTKIKGYITGTITWSGIYTSIFPSGNTRGASFYPKPMGPPYYGSGYVQATATNACGNAVVATAGYGGCATGFASTFSYSVYPNPSSSELKVELLKEKPEASVETNESKLQAKEKESFEAILYDQQNRKILSSKAIDGKITLNTSNIPRGIYVLHVINGQSRETTTVQIDK